MWENSWVQLLFKSQRSVQRSLLPWKRITPLLLTRNTLFLQTYLSTFLWPCSHQRLWKGFTRILAVAWQKTSQQIHYQGWWILIFSILIGWRKIWQNDQLVQSKIRKVLLCIGVCNRVNQKSVDARRPLSLSGWRSGSVKNLKGANSYLFYSSC